MINDSGVLRALLSPTALSISSSKSLLGRAKVCFERRDFTRAGIELVLVVRAGTPHALVFCNEKADDDANLLSLG
jgi:hypothetical protein